MTERDRERDKERQRETEKDRERQKKGQKDVKEVQKEREKKNTLSLEVIERRLRPPGRQKEIQRWRKSSLPI